MSSASIGIRDLKTNLSRHLKRVQSGQTIRVTDRGRTIATIQPAAAPPANLAWVHEMVAEGQARWSGGKPGIAKPVKARPGARLASEIVIEDRR